MIRFDIPGMPRLTIEHLVLDYNGTIARDGRLMVEIADMARQLSQKIEVHVVTADTHGTVRRELAAHPFHLEVIGNDQQDRAKLSYISSLGKDRVAAVGNGKNDRLMLEGAALGIAVASGEGCSSQAAAAADVICFSTVEALGLLLFPQRLIATLRN